LTTPKVKGAARLSNPLSSLYRTPNERLLTDVEWEQIVATLGDPDTEHREACFAVGDCWLAGAHLPYAVRKRILERLGWDERRIRRCYKLGSIAKRYPNGSFRRHDVPFSFFEDAAKLPPDFADRLLADAACGHWSRARFRAQRYRKVVPPDAMAGDISDDVTDLIARDRRYPTFLADPSWPYRDIDRPGGGVGARYERMFMPAILNMGPLIKQVSERDAYLGLMTTWGFLRESFDVIDAWGFTYCWSGVTWHKVGKMGCGSYFRLEDEFLMLAKRGNPPPFADHGIRNVLLSTPRGEHSEKPDEIYDFLRRACPGPYLELFGRKSRPGWDVCLGNSFKLSLPPRDEDQTE
jgi:N6-adenosine-specific RNA methylase IME4